MRKRILILNILLLLTFLIFYSSCDIQGAPKYSVIYDANNSTTGFPPKDSNKYEVGDSILVLGNAGDLARENFRFTGWNTKSDGSGVNYQPGQRFYIGPTNTVLYASWTDASDFSITYYGNNNSDGSPPLDNSVYQYKESVTVSGNIYGLEREEYTFVGWNTRADGKGVLYAVGDTFLMPNGNVALYAFWSKPHCVKYYSNGAESGTAPVDIQKYLLNETVIILGSEEAFAKHEHAFLGWNTKPDGSGITYLPGDELIMPESDIELFAKWEINTYSVSYDTNGGTDVGCQLIGYGSIIPEPQSPEKEYYSFNGWYLDESFIHAWDFSADVVLEPITLFAKWESLLPTTFAGGVGTIDSPYQVATPGQLYLIRNYMDKHFIQVADLDLSYFSQGEGWEPLGAFWGHDYAENEYFTGSYDGNGFLIKNLAISKPNRDAIGLFGYTQENAEIRNVRLVDVNVHGRKYVGGLIGMNYSTRDIKDCSVNGIVEGDQSYVGGLVGLNNVANVLSCCEYRGRVIGGYYTGGLVGYSRGDFEYCLADVIVKGRQKVGGLVGDFSGDYIMGCHTAGEVQSLFTGSGALIFSTGGLVGENADGEISNCHTTADVKGSYRVGGLVGTNRSGIISMCTSSGSVVGGADMPSETGGFIGSNGGEIFKCSSESEVKGLTYTGGFVGKNSGIIHECLSLGNVVGTKSVGGFVGYMINNGQTVNCYAKGAVNGTERVGGFLGEGTSGSLVSLIINCYSTGVVSGYSGLGGLVGIRGEAVNSFYDLDTSGLSDDIGRGVPKNTIDMMQLSTFTGWDFSSIWTISAGISYPALCWEND